MKEILFVNAEQLQTLEHYGAETGKTICWEIQRLLALYKTQIENVLDRTNLSEKEVLENLKAMMPAVKIPRKRKSLKKDV
jgi:hypothetical protein